MNFNKDFGLGALAGAGATGLIWLGCRLFGKKKNNKQTKQENAAAPQGQEPTKPAAPAKPEEKPAEPAKPAEGNAKPTEEKKDK